MAKPIIIIGGGLAGLYAATKLHERNIAFLLLEAKPRLGGRIYCENSIKNENVGFDLGPTWIFPHQPKIQSLVKSLNLSIFEQYNHGDVLYQAPNQAIQQIAGAGEMQLFRLKHGMNTLIKALYKQLPAKHILLNHCVTELKKSNDNWQLTVNNNGKIQQFETNTVLTALPPRMIAQHLTPNFWASERLINRLTTTPTWMAGQAKFVATFDYPFWRERNLSGQCFSRVGPMVEIHDASAEHNKHAALFGFIGVPYSTRSKVTKAQLIEACINQLVYFYGEAARNPTHCFVKDWAEDEFVANNDDKTQPSQHPDFHLGELTSELRDLNIHLVGSEFAKKEAGYLEGALNAVDDALSAI